MKQSKIKIKGETITMDAKDQVLGRLAVKITDILRGKNNPNFLPYKEASIAVIVFNTNQIKITGNKREGKIYYRHSGYPGGIKEESLGDVMKKDSTVAVRRAVYGMLPKNRLRDKAITRLFLFKEGVPNNLTDSTPKESLVSISSDESGQNDK